MSTFSDLHHKMSRMQNLSRDGHGKSRNCHGKVQEFSFCKVCGNTDKARAISVVFTILNTWNTLFEYVLFESDDLIRHLCS